ncbi:MAG: hypoxanthine phosphoribosyltransferase [Candidatus Melainabacteria bacterium]|nr:hypoxanthine phosphoribosyltransferase [Candidatus Melainabacteria bacterium]
MKEFTNRVFFRKWGYVFFLACAGLNADNSKTQEMQNFELVISQEEIKAKVKEVAKTLDQQYKGKELTVVIVMKGALCIAADLIRELTIPCTVEYIRAASYGHRGVTRGELKIEGLENLDITSKDVLLVDDIFDTGVTVSQILTALEKKNPSSLKSLVLLEKMGTSEVSYRPDYALFQIENLFVIGFGLDYKEQFRGLPGIYIYK